MSHPAFGRSLLIVTLVTTAVAAGCDRSGDDDSVEELTDDGDRAPALPPQSPEELAQPLAKVDSVVITVGEFQSQINRQSPYVRRRYTSLEQKREFLDNMVRFEVLAGAAKKRGLDKHPDVVRTMKQVMIQKLMKEEFADKVDPEDISEEEMKAFYEEHADEYDKPEEVRASAIILKSRAKARRVAEEAKGEAGATNKGFRELVSKYSRDDKTKIRGGDLRYFGRDSEEIPKRVVDAAFDLEKTGDVTGPIAAGDGTHYVIKLTGRRRAITKSFETVKRQIQNRIYRDRRSSAQKEFIDKLREQANIEIFEKNLSKVEVDTSKDSSSKH